MTKSAREFIEEFLSKNSGRSNYFLSKFLIEDLFEAGYVILPKEPSEGFALAGGESLYGATAEQAEEWGKGDKLDWRVEQFKEAYRAAISHAEGEKG